MISPDLPITRSSDDKLNRQSFAESLARVLLSSTFPTSFTVGLYGAWGSGKTSLLNMVIEQVEDKNKDVIVKEYIRSIRDVIRYSNVFYLKYNLLQDETDPVDLLGLTCLQVFEPTIYSMLNDYKDTICGSSDKYTTVIRQQL